MKTGFRVLLIDNNADSLRLATNVLVADGYTPYVCGNCEHAARVASLVRPNVILFNGCDGNERTALDALLGAAPYIPLVRHSAGDDGYRVFSARGRKRGYVPTESRFGTIRSAIHSAVFEALEMA